MVIHDPKIDPNPPDKVHPWDGDNWLEHKWHAFEYRVEPKIEEKEFQFEEYLSGDIEARAYNMAYTKAESIEKEKEDTLIVRGNNAVDEHIAQKKADRLAAAQNVQLSGTVHDVAVNTRPGKYQKVEEFEREPFVGPVWQPDDMDFDY